MKLLDHINQSLGLNEGEEYPEIAANMHTYLVNFLKGERPQYSDIEEMYQDLYAKLQDVRHDDIGSSIEHRNYMDLGNFDNKGGVVDSVIADVDLEDYLPATDEYGDPLPEGQLDGYYLEKDAMKLWLDDNPGKTKRDWEHIGVDVSDEYTEKAGGKKGRYLGKGASEWTRTDRFGSDSTWTRTKESDDDVDYKNMRAGEFAKAHGDQWRKKSAENEDAVAKMIAQALGDESRWDEMSAHELYSELESVDVEMADVVKMTAKLIHDVDLTESKAAK